MKLTLSKQEKQQLGWMIKALRKQTNRTQQQLLEECLYSVSLRSIVSLEKGNALKDDDLYDELLAVFSLECCYDEQLMDQVNMQVLEIFNAYQNYDLEMFHKACIKTREYIKDKKHYVQIYFIEQALSCIEDLYIHKEFVSEYEYNILSNQFMAYDDMVKMMVAEAIYLHEYQHAHNNETLALWYEKMQPLQSYHCTRFCIVLVLHLLDKQKDYLHAYLLLLRLEKEEAKKEILNVHIQFALTQWKANLEVFLLPDAYASSIEKCEVMLQEYTFYEYEIKRYLHNTSTGFYHFKNYEKACEYYKRMQAYKGEYALPTLIWYYNMQYYVNKTLPPYEEVDVSNCSEQLQVCWQYFVLKQEGADAITLENYIMKIVVPYLKGLSDEFAKVYFMQLNDLVKETRNYKQLHVFMEKLGIFTFL